MERGSSLQVKDICVDYAGMKVLDHVDMRICSGEIVCLVGESGSGKSTLLNTIMGTLPVSSCVSQGSVEIDGRDLTALSEKELREVRGKLVAMVFQNADMALCPVVKVRKHFEDTFRAHGAYEKSTFKPAVLEMLAKLGLEDGERILRSYPFELSGGMSQRVGIALACALHPRFLLADEPTSALDVTTQLQVIAELARLRDEFGVGVLLATHNMGVVANIADKVGVCYAGQLVEFGSLDQVMGNPLHPYTSALLEATPRLNGGMPQGLEGRPPRFDDMPEGCRFAARCRYAEEGCHVLQERRGTAEHWCLCPRGADGNGTPVPGSDVPNGTPVPGSDVPLSAAWQEGGGNAGA